jgi:hypothetical protein
MSMSFDKRTFNIKPKYLLNALKRNLTSPLSLTGSNTDTARF